MLHNHLDTKQAVAAEAAMPAWFHKEHGEPMVGFVGTNSPVRGERAVLARDGPHHPRPRECRAKC